MQILNMLSVYIVYQSQRFRTREEPQLAVRPVALLAAAAQLLSVAF